MSGRPVAVENESGPLVSSSPFLNDPGIREFFSTHFLRKNAKGYPTISDNIVLNRALSELRDREAVDAWFERERKTSEPLDRWMTERHISTFTVEDLEKCPPGSVGKRYHEYTVDVGIELDVGFRLQTRDWVEYANVRASRNHDFDHILTGGSFTYPGEMVPVVAVMTNTYTFLSPEFASLLGSRGLGPLRFLTRAALHYPKSVWPFFEGIAQGVKVGLDSEPIRLLNIDELLHLPVEAAREAAGIRGAYDVESEPWASHFLNPMDDEAVAADAHLPYYRRGMREIQTRSSVPASSSKYLNDVRLRDWTPTALLRKAGPDYPDRDEFRYLEHIMDGLRDRRRIDALIGEAVGRDPLLARRLSAPPAITAEALAAKPAGSVGDLLLRRLRENGELDLLGPSPGHGDWDRLYRRLSLDEEILAVVLGSTGDALDGILPGWAMVVSLYRDLDPELAAELCNARILGLLRFVTRAQLHYPRSWITVARAWRQGILVGQALPALFTLPYEDVLELTPARAREQLQIRGWEAIDTRPASAAYGEEIQTAAVG